MRYEGDIYSPHIAGDDYILQCTIGCSHNLCTFCHMYKDKKFRIRELSEILEDIRLAKEFYGDLKKVFLADGDALSMPAADLKIILNSLYNTFSGLDYVGVYASAPSILNKTPAELKLLEECGLTEAHLGVESGDEEILSSIRKGVNYWELVQAGGKIKQAGINLVITLILGLAGSMPKAAEHAFNSAKICNEMQPDYIGLLTIFVQPGTELYEKTQSGNFKIPGDWEILNEMRLLIQNMNLKHCGITSIHPSNCISLEGFLPKDKNALLKTLDRIIKTKDISSLRPKNVLKV